MLAHIRTATSRKQPPQDPQDHHPNDECTAIVMRVRDNVRNQRVPLADIDYRRDARFAHVLAETYMREFASLVKCLNQVNVIAAKYHEHAFDNTNDYIIGLGQSQSSPDEMTVEQQHASKILFSVGNSYSEITVAIRMLGCGSIHAPRDVVACDDALIESLAQHFHTADQCVIEDAFDRLHHIVSHVWKLVNTLAMANLFRFADSTHPIFIATSDDAIFVPHIPTRHHLS